MPHDDATVEENVNRAPNNVRPFIRPIAVPGPKIDRDSRSHAQGVDPSKNDDHPGPSAA